MAFLLSLARGPGEPAARVRENEVGLSRPVGRAPFGDASQVAASTP